MKKIYSLILYVLTLSTIVCFGGCSSEMDKLISDYNLTIHNETLEISEATEAFTIAMIADTHISLCDQRDVTVYSKASSRYDGFLSSDGTTADVSFKNLMEYTIALNPDVIILAGDIVDSAMELSIELVTEQIEIAKEAGIEVFYSMGNHDFEYGSEYFSDKCYSDYLPRFGGISDTSDGYQVKEYNGVIIFMADDAKNQVSKEAAEKLEELSNGDKPVIVVSHVPLEPLVESDFWQKTIDVWNADSNGRSRVLYGDNSCIPNENTKSFINSITKDGTSVVSVLSGHVHFYDKSTLSNNGVVQITTGAGYLKEMTIVKVKGKK